MFTEINDIVIAIGYRLLLPNNIKIRYVYPLTYEQENDEACKVHYGMIEFNKKKILSFDSWILFPLGFLIS